MGKDSVRESFCIREGNSCTMSEGNQGDGKQGNPPEDAIFTKAFFTYNPSVFLLTVLWFGFASSFILIYVQALIAVSFILIFVFKNISWDPRNLLWYVYCSTG